jgi:serine/threonine protein kinase
LAPEVRMKKKYDKSVDFWSFGVLLHTMLYGRMPKSSKKNRDSIDIKFPDPDFNDSTKDDTHPFIRYIIQSSFDCIHLILQ